MNIGALIEKRIRRLMADRGVQVGDLQREAGLNVKFLQNLKRAKIGPSVGTLKPIKEILGTTWDYLIDGRGDGIDERRRPRPDNPVDKIEGGVVAVPERDIRIAAGGGSIADDAPVRRTWGLPESFLYTLSLKAEAVEFVEIVGDSMYPLLWPGDMVLVDRRSKNPDHRAIYALYDGDAIVCKWVERDHAAKPAAFLLSSENPTCRPYRVPVERANIAGRVVWFGRRL